MLIIFSVIFQQNLTYLESFLESLKNQSDKEFKLFLVNDGAIDISIYISKCDFEIEVFNVNGLQPFELRILGLKELLKRNLYKTEYIVFADTDDLMGANRVELSKQYLKVYPFVCHDLSLMTDDGAVYKKFVWSNRIKDDFEFDFEFIINKNVIGFGNSGMRANLLLPVLEKMRDLKFGNDWLFFSSFEHELKVFFIKESPVLYRQHDNNLIGRKSLSEDSLIRIIKNKIYHFSILKTIGVTSFNVDQFRIENEAIYKYFITNIFEIKKQIGLINSLNMNFFWWEESNYIKINK